MEVGLSLGPEGLIASLLFLKMSLKGRGRWEADCWGFTCVVLRFQRKVAMAKEAQPN